MSTLGVDDVQARCQAVLEQVERAVIGKREPLEMVLMGILADGHVLLEDYPGLAKTLVARSFAQVLAIGFARVQFTPDLMPSDVTGSSIYRQSDATFEFRPGPVFTNLLLADEINRAPPKTQSALLEAMAERQVTIEGETRPLESPFLVIATQNPIEYEGTYPLPEAQLDRFLMRLALGYPARDDEWEVLERRMQRMADDITLEPVCTREELIEMQRAVETVHVDRSVGLYMVDLVTATRGHGQVQVGASPRGTLALLKLARCRAMLDGRDFVSPDDVKAIAIPALGHRLTLRPEMWIRRISGDDIIREVLDAVPTPSAQALVGTGSVIAIPAAKLRGYAALTAALVWAAIGLHRPELVAVAAPFGLLLAVGLAATVPPRVEVRVPSDEIRALEGTTVTLETELSTESQTVGALTVEPRAPAGLVAARSARMVRLEPDAPAVLPVELVCTRWGGYLAGGMTLRVPGPLGLIRFEQVVEASVPVRVYPAVERLRALPRPTATNVGSGNYVTRIRGEGLEFADLRPHVPGDRLRRVNWRVSARRGRLHVNEYHPERNADVVLFLDAFSDTRDGAGGTIDMTVRAAAALASAYLRTRDRVGIVGFGGVMRWVLPSSGTTQVYRILDSVIDTQVVVSYAWRDVAYIPARTLPPHALVVALSPLSDRRMLSALADLRARGIDLAMIDVSPLPFVAAPPGEMGELAHRLWRLQRQQVVSRFRAMGVPVAEWRHGRPVDEVLAQLQEVRRYARTVRI